MNHLRSHNEDLLATLTAGLLFVYVWLGLFVLLYFMYQSGFFGYSLGGMLVTGLICLFFITPIVPGLISRFLVKPLFVNLLGREIITISGCISGIVLMLLCGLAMVFFLTRDLQTSWILFLTAPIAGGILASLVSLLGRSAGISSALRGLFRPRRGGGYRPRRFR